MGKSTIDVDNSTCLLACLLACLLKSVEFDDDVALRLGDAGLDVGPHVAP